MIKPPRSATRSFSRVKASVAPQLQRPFFQFKNDAFEHAYNVPDRVLGRVVS